MTELPTALEYTTVHVTIQDLIEDATADTKGKVIYTPLVTTVPGIDGKIHQVNEIREYLVGGSSSVNLLTGITWRATFALQGPIVAPDPVEFTTDGTTINLAYEVTAVNELVESRTVVVAGVATTAALTAGLAGKQDTATLEADTAALVGTAGALDASLDARYRTQARAHGLPSIVTKGYTFESWPTIVQTPTGRIVVSYSSGAPSHSATTSRDLFVVYSDDEGKTWSDPVTIISDTSFDYACFGAGLDSSGNPLLWVRYRTGAGATDSMHLYRSTDDGATWAIRSSPTLATTPELIMNIVSLGDGTLLAPWHTATGSYSWGLVTSSDDGATWAQSTIRTGGSLVNFPVEAQLYVASDGRILGIARTQIPGDPLIQLQSDDDGATFSEANTSITDQAYSNGALVGPDDDLSMYYVHRDTDGGFVRERRARFDDVWGAPSAWSDSRVIGYGSTRLQDFGQANAVRLASGETRAVYFHGSQSQSAIFIIDGADGTDIGSAQVAKRGMRFIAEVGIQVSMSLISNTPYFSCSSTASVGDFLGGAYLPLREWMAQGRLFYRIIGVGYTGSGNTLSLTMRYWDNNSTAQTVTPATVTSTSTTAFDTGWVEVPSTFATGGNFTTYSQVQFRAWNSGTASNGKVQAGSRIMFGLLPA